jgi:hypothetical protein
MKDSSRVAAVIVVALSLLGLGAVIMSNKRRPITRSMTRKRPGDERILTSKYFESPPGSPQDSSSDEYFEEVMEKGVEILPNSGGGDCLFHCFKAALLSYGTRTSIRALRKVVADAATQDQFETLKVIYDNAVKEKEYQIINDYLFMNGVNDLEGLRKAMMKRSYWGDEMALRALEKRTKMKVLVFTTITGEMELASQLDTKEVPESGKYMMVLLHNQHYQLVKYGDKVVLRFNDLPPQIQDELKV